MADNYLEKKMEEHRLGSVRPKERRSPTGNRPGSVLLPVVAKNSFVVGGDDLSPVLQICARALRSTGCRTAFCCTDRVFGSKTAQSDALQYYPISEDTSENINAAIAKAESNLGHLDVVVRYIDGEILIDMAGRISRVRAAEMCPKAIFSMSASRLLLYLLLPQSKDICLSGNFQINSDGSLTVVKD